MKVKWRRMDDDVTEQRKRGESGSGVDKSRLTLVGAGRS